MRMSLNDIFVLSIPAAIALLFMPGPGFNWLVGKVGSGDRAVFIFGSALCLVASALFALFLSPAGKDSLGLYRAGILGLGLMNLALLGYNLIVHRNRPKA